MENTTCSKGNQIKQVENLVFINTNRQALICHLATQNEKIQLEKSPNSIHHVKVEDKILIVKQIIPVVNPFEMI